MPHWSGGYRGKMLQVVPLRYLVSAEALVLFATFICWWRVWKVPDAGRIKLAALSSCILIGFRAVSLSIAIMATTPR